VVNNDFACRFHPMPFHAFSAVVTFAAAAVRAPSTSLTNTIQFHVRDGLQVLDAVKSEYWHSHYRVSAVLQYYLSIVQYNTDVVADSAAFA
jgi:hypothetical protein